RGGVELIVQLAGVDAELTEVVSQHDFVLEAVREDSIRPDTCGVRASKKLVGDRAIIHFQPERKRSLCGPRRRQRADTGPESKPGIDRVIQESPEDNLSGQP